MEKTLDKLVQDSCAGCITDERDIEEIFDRMGKMTWGDLVDLVDRKAGENGMILLGAALETGYDIYTAADERVRELGLPEALCLINKENYFSWRDLKRQDEYESGDDFGDGDEYESYEDIEEGERYAFYGEMMYEDPMYYYQSDKEILEGKYSSIITLLSWVLNEAQKTDNLFRMFFGIGIEALFRYLDKLNRNRLPGSENEDDFRLKAAELGIGIDSRTSIGDIFKGADAARNKAWNPSRPIVEYRDGILDAYNLYKIPLFDSFERIFPERSVPQRIIEDGGLYEAG